MKFFVGIFLIAIGLVMVLKTDWLLSFFGRSAWAEEKLGAEGGSRLFYKMIGIGLILLAFLIMSGRIVSLLDFIFVRQ